MHITKKLPKFSALAVAVVLGGLMFLGFRYPLVGRDEIMIGMPRSLMSWDFALALIYTVARVCLTRDITKKRGHLLFGDICHFIAAAVFLLGILPLINGTLDYNPVRVHQTTVANKRVEAGRYGVHYYLIVTDWRTPKKLVSLNVSQDDYLGIDGLSGPQLGDPIQVATSNGFLGYERVRGIK